MNAYIVDAVRTHVGKYGGAFAKVRGDDLAAATLRAIVDRSALSPSNIDEVILGAANQSGDDNRNVARMALLLAGFLLRFPDIPSIDYALLDCRQLHQLLKLSARAALM